MYEHSYHCGSRLLSYSWTSQFLSLLFFRVVCTLFFFFVCWQFVFCSSWLFSFALEEASKPYAAVRVELLARPPSFNRQRCVLVHKQRPMTWDGWSSSWTGSPSCCGSASRKLITKTNTNGISRGARRTHHTCVFSVRSRWNSVEGNLDECFSTH